MKLQFNININIINIYYSNKIILIFFSKIEYILKLLNY